MSRVFTFCVKAIVLIFQNQMNTADLRQINAFRCLLASLFGTSLGDFTWYIWHPTVLCPRFNLLWVQQNMHLIPPKAISSCAEVVSLTPNLRDRKVRFCMAVSSNDLSSSVKLPGTLFLHRHLFWDRKGTETTPPPTGQGAYRLTPGVNLFIGIFFDIQQACLSPEYYLPISCDY